MIGENSHVAAFCRVLDGIPLGEERVGCFPYAKPREQPLLAQRPELLVMI